MKLRPTRHAAAALLALVGLSTQAGELLVNGSFEQQVLNDGEWTVLTSLAGWQTDASSGVELRRAVAGLAQEGHQYVELDTHFGRFPDGDFDASTNSAIWQDVTTVSGGTYLMSYWYAPRAGISAASNAIDVWWNDTLLTTSTGSGMGHDGNEWSSFSFSVQGTGQDRLRFAGAGTQDTLGGSLDNVSLQDVPSFRALRGSPLQLPPAVPAIPEPGTWALMAAGLAVVARVARRRLDR